ncbi:hypothetical protein V2J09_007956 [Rumex salicifolius]
MNYLQRIHPFPDLESAAAGSPVPHPAAPLLPFSISSEKGDPSTAPTPPPLPHHNHFRRRLLTSLLFLGLLLGFLAAGFFLVFRPKLPHYSVTGLHVINLSLSPNNTLSTAFIVHVTARNPNERIGIYYDVGSRLTVQYSGATKLCQGNLPVFFQGHHNTTVVKVALYGATPNATAVARGMLHRSDGGGGVALVVEGRMRVRLKLGKLKLGMRKMK